MFGRPHGPRLGGHGGSPFQMPARLADGLGLKGDLDNGSRRHTPHPRSLEELVPPRHLAGRQDSLGCCHINRHKARPSQSKVGKGVSKTLRMKEMLSSRFNAWTNLCRRRSAINKGQGEIYELGVDNGHIQDAPFEGAALRVVL